jgi:predicted DNA-binding transcriptional regulator YafY
VSFAKARQILRLAHMAAGRYRGVTLEDIAAEFDCSHRTAQRMTDALEEIFAQVEVNDDGDDGRRRWRLRPGAAGSLGLRDDEIVEALDVALRDARATNRHRHEQALGRLRDRVLHDLPAQAARRAESDAEAMLAALGNVARPGPRSPIARDVAEAVHDALRGPFRLVMRYGTDPLMERVVEPLGVLLGPRSYLVAVQPDRGTEIRHFRMDRIVVARCRQDSFIPPEGFSLAVHAARAFGAWQDPRELREVVWLFHPDAVEAAADYQFHPDQRTEPQADGSLIVRFRAAGWLEMAWHLYTWGDKVEVLAPPELARMVEDHRRGDFPGLP